MKTLAMIAFLGMAFSPITTVVYTLSRSVERAVVMETARAATAVADAARDVDAEKADRVEFEQR